MEISRIKIENYKSIRELDLELRDVNILIGGNGVGKSNFISFFKLLKNLISNNLQAYIAKVGGPDNIHHHGLKTSSTFSWQIFFYHDGAQNYYKAKMAANRQNKSHFIFEEIGFDKVSDGENWYRENLGGPHFETDLHAQKDLKKKQRGYAGTSEYVTNAFEQFKVYHFHDTSDTAGVKLSGNISDNRYLREDASNLAAFLYRLQQTAPNSFKQIESTLRRVAPFFDKFVLEPDAINPREIQLEWREKGSEKYFNGHDLSDGTLRMICLLTLMLQPEPPATIIIDEPELGLHPFAINMLASVINSVKHKSQIILGTQSVTLIDQFTPEDIIVVDRKEGQSVFQRITKDQYEDWLDDYSMGEIWEKNLIGGRP